MYLFAMLAVGMGVMPIMVNDPAGEPSANASTFSIVRQP